MTLNSSSKTTATTEIRRNGINTQNCSSIFNEQDHLPLSHVQEKLKGDDAPLVENVDSFLIKPIQSRHYTYFCDYKCNTIDNIGEGSTQGTTQETENSSSENQFEMKQKRIVQKDNSKEEPMVFMNARENRIESITEAEEKDNTVSNVTIETTLRNKRSDNLLRDSGYGEKAT
ncbi:11309_t:CDS:2, partial [Funneliformis caledonium]